MKKVFVLLVAIIISGMAMAQTQTQKKGLPQPFKGGNDAMMRFFKDSLQVSPEIIKARANGMCIFKFTADTKGTITKIVVYYADDLLLAQPAIDALKRTNGKWVIPEEVKSYDFILPFSINFIPSDANRIMSQKAMYTYYANRKPVLATNQIPLMEATLLPTVIVNYEQ